MKYITPVLAAFLGFSSAVKLQHHHRHHHKATPLSNFQPWTRNNFESADQDADNSRASNDIPEHCIHNVAGHCGITSSKQVAQPTVYGPQPAGGYAAVYPVNNMIAQIAATPLSNFQPWTRNNFESADQDADNSRASNDIPEHCIHNVAGHCGITSSKQVAQPTVYGPQPAGGYAAVYPVNNMIAQLDATPLSNFQPWTRNNFESADQDADNSRASNDIPEHCIHNVAGHCGITSSKQVAQPTVYGPQPAGGYASVYPVNNMIAQLDSTLDATPLSNFQPWTRNNFESADQDADNSRASNDIPEHCIHNVAGHCGITSSKQVAQPTVYGPQPAGGYASVYPVNNMIAQLSEEGPLYVPHAYAGATGVDLSKVEHCPDFNERMTLLNGKTKAVAYPTKGWNCNADHL